MKVQSSSSNTNFGYITFKSVKDCTQAFKLTHIRIKNSTISIFRFKKNYKTSEIPNKSPAQNPKRAVVAPKNRRSFDSLNKLESDRNTPKNFSVESLEELETDDFKPGSKSYHMVMKNTFRRLHRQPNINFKRENRKSSIVYAPQFPLNFQGFRIQPSFYRYPPHPYRMMNRRPTPQF